MGSQVWVTIASESVHETNCSKASAIHFQVSTASGFALTEPPTMARPRHQLSLGSSRYRHTVTSTSYAMPYVKPHWSSHVAQDRA